MKHIKKFEAYALGTVAAAPVDIFLHYYVCPTCKNVIAGLREIPQQAKCHPELKEVNKKDFFNFLYKNAETPEKIKEIDRMKDQIESDIVPLEQLPHKDDDYGYSN